MNSRRRITQNTSIINPLQGGKAGSKDPRNFQSGFNGGSNLWDMRQQQVAEQDLYRDPPPQFAQVHADVAPPQFVVQTNPLRISFQPWTVLAVTMGAPYLLLKRNPYRAGLIVCNPSNDSLLISFGPFQANAAGVLFGMIVPLAGNLQFTGETIPTDDIYVLNNTAAGRLQLCFEGIPTLEGNA